MVLTYHEAELVAADAMSSAAPDLWSAGTGNYLARIVLEAVGYADLLAEVADDDIECAGCDREGPAAFWDDDDYPWCATCHDAHYAALWAERDALAATLARVKVEGDRWANSKNYTSQFAGGLLREALRPPAADDE